MVLSPPHGHTNQAAINLWLPYDHEYIYWATVWDGEGLWPPPTGQQHHGLPQQDVLLSHR